MPSRQADLRVFVGQGSYPGACCLDDRHAVLDRELLQAGIENGACVAAADHGGHAVQRRFERQIERAVTAVHQHVRTGLHLGKGTRPGGEVIGSGAAARDDLAVESRGGKPGPFLLDLGGGLMDEGGAYLTAVPVHRVALVRLQAAKAEPVMPGGLLGERDQAGVAERQPAPAGADVQLDQHPDRHAMPAGHPGKQVQLRLVVDHHGKSGERGSPGEFVQCRRVDHLIRDQYVGKPGAGQDQSLP